MQALQIDTVYELDRASELADPLVLNHHTSAPRILIIDSTTARRCGWGFHCLSFISVCHLFSPCFLFWKITGKILSACVCRTFFFKLLWCFLTGRQTKICSKICRHLLWRCFSKILLFVIIQWAAQTHVWSLYTIIAVAQYDEQWKRPQRPLLIFCDSSQPLQTLPCLQLSKWQPAHRQWCSHW